MKNVEFEAGVVYERRSQLYLAVNQRVLVSFHNGEWLEVRPYVKYRALRDLSVAELCRNWKVTSEQFDDQMAQYFTPESRRAREERNTRRRSWGDSHWRHFRTFRHSLERRAS